METKGKRIAEFQADLKKRQDTSTHIVVYVSVVIIAVVVAILLSSPSYGGINILLDFAIVIGLIVLFLRDPVSEINISSLEKKLQREIDSERKYIHEIKADYALFRDCKINDIPREFRELAGNLLLSKSRENPEEYIARRERELSEMEFRLEMYQKVSERNFWQYFISWKWLKKGT